MSKETDRQKCPCASCTWIKVETNHIIAERDRLKAANAELLKVLYRLTNGAECTCQDLEGTGFTCNVCQGKAAITKATA